MDDRWSTTLARLEDDGDLPKGFKTLFERVDRAAFIPDQFWDYDEDEQLYLVDRTADPDLWAGLVYSDTALVTQLDQQRRPSSSSSQPSIMAIMLAALDPQPDKQVIELGTGTGYNAALLAERVGARNVVTIEIDPVIARTAQHRLQEAGYQLGVTESDGGTTIFNFDHLIATYAVDTIPQNWLLKANPGAIIVVPWRNRLLEQAVLRLEITDGGIGPDGDGMAIGRLMGGCSFMSDRRAWRGSQTIPDGGEVSWTKIGPAYLEAVPISMWLSRDLTGCLLYCGKSTRFLHDTTSDSWAVLDLDSEEDGAWQVRQIGPRQIWDELTASLHAWFDAGQPDLEVWRVIVEENGVISLILDD